MCIDPVRDSDYHEVLHSLNRSEDHPIWFKERPNYKLRMLSIAHRTSFSETDISVKIVNIYLDSLANN